MRGLTDAHPGQHTHTKIFFIRQAAERESVRTCDNKHYLIGSNVPLYKVIKAD